MNTIKSVLKRLFGYFLAGAFAILPLVITVAIVIWVVGFLQSYLGPDTLVGSWVQSLGLRVASDGCGDAFPQHSLYIKIKGQQVWQLMAFNFKFGHIRKELAQLFNGQKVL